MIGAIPRVCAGQTASLSRSPANIWGTASSVLLLLLPRPLSPPSPLRSVTTPGLSPPWLSRRNPVKRASAGPTLLSVSQTRRCIVSWRT